MTAPGPLSVPTWKGALSIAARCALRPAAAQQREAQHAEGEERCRAGLGDRDDVVQMKVPRPERGPDHPEERDVLYVGERSREHEGLEVLQSAVAVLNAVQDEGRV